MRQLLFLSLLAAFLLVNYGCEKVIEVPLNEADQRIVVEGVLKDKPGESYILLSKTAPVYENAAFEKISNASVEVKDHNGQLYVFTEDINVPGKYVLPSFVVNPYTVYDLTINIEGQIISSQARSEGYAKIDSLTWDENILGFGGVNDTIYLVSYHAVDQAGDPNYYRLKFWINERESNVFYLGDDTFIDGQHYEAPFFGEPTRKGDTVKVEMLMMDEACYRYFYSLSDNVDQSAFSGAPANPVSNLTGDAIGYFGVFMTDTISAILP